MKKIFQSLLIVVLAVSCTNQKDEEIPSFHQKVLFEMHQASSFMGHQETCYLVDSSGYEFHFQSSINDTIKWNNPDKDGYISLAEMNENLSHCNMLIGTVNPDTLSHYIGKIWAASKGKISESVTEQWFDAGIITYSAFIFDEKTNRYKKVMIKTKGDWMIDNDAPEAEEIYQWMMRINFTIILCTTPIN